MAPERRATASSYSTLRWVMMTPLGLPVVPDVYSRVTGSSGVMAAIRSVTTDGVAASLPRPRAAKSAQVM